MPLKKLFSAAEGEFEERPLRSPFTTRETMSKDKHQRDRQKPRLDLKRLRADIGNVKPATPKGAPQKAVEPTPAAAQKAAAAIAQVAADIAARLGETEEQPLGLIERTVQYLGAEAA